TGCPWSSRGRRRPSSPTPAGSRSVTRSTISRRAPAGSRPCEVTPYHPAAARRRLPPEGRRADGSGPPLAARGTPGPEDPRPAPRLHRPRDARRDRGAPDPRRRRPAPRRALPDPGVPLDGLYRIATSRAEFEEWVRREQQSRLATFHLQLSEMTRRADRLWPLEPRATRPPPGGGRR